MAFFPIKYHDREYLFKKLHDFLTTNGINIQNCYFQSFDNSSNISGAYFGEKAHFKAVCNKAD